MTAKTLINNLKIYFIKLKQKVISNISFEKSTSLKRIEKFNKYKIPTHRINRCELYGQGERHIVRGGAGFGRNRHQNFSADRHHVRVSRRYGWRVLRRQFGEKPRFVSVWLGLSWKMFSEYLEIIFINVYCSSLLENNIFWIKLPRQKPMYVNFG